MQKLDFQGIFSIFEALCFLKFCPGLSQIKNKQTFLQLILDQKLQQVAPVLKTPLLKNVVGGKIQQTVFLV